jgi:uncharacterized heparinase superfamily protein
MLSSAVVLHDQDADLLGRMRQRLQSLAYSSRLYRLMISGPVPKALSVVPTDPWPGDLMRGQDLIDGHFVAAGQRFPAHPPQWLPDKANTGWLIHVHGFTWLSDLRASGGDTARRLSRSLLASWLDAFENWAPFVWEPALVARRIVQLVGLHDFVLGSADATFRTRVFESLVRHHRHLLRLAPAALASYGAAEALDNNVHLPAQDALQGGEALDLLSGLVFAGVALPDGERALKLALEILPTALRRCFLADGGVITRSPAVQVQSLKCLIDIRHALKAATIALPPELPMAIERAASALRFFRHGDGGLALFNGGVENDPAFVEVLFRQADVRSRAPKTLPQSGYERLHGGRLLVLVDAGAPAPTSLDDEAHAGFGSFEASLGRERLIVNCGHHPGAEPGPWTHALAATAAHSTITVGDTNLCEIFPQGGVGARPEQMRSQRRDTAGRMELETEHDGYRPGFGLLHKRRLILLVENEELHGEDILQGSDAKKFALRFHLHPLVQVSLIQNGTAALFRLPSGTGARLRLEEGIFELEESLYYGKSEPRRSHQLVFRGETRGQETLLRWSLMREKKAGVS